MKPTDPSVLFLVVLAVLRTSGSLTCSRYAHGPRPEYHLTKECAASTMRTVASSNATGLDLCAELAAVKNAFAFAYANQTGGSENLVSPVCNVYECPEFHPFLLSDIVSVYDYYSMFSKPLPSENYTCAPSVGMFEIVTDRANYSNAMVACEEAGGHLANVASDSRTSFLAALVSSALGNQTSPVRKAFVGMFFEDEFVTVTGEPLSCLPYRAWAPGHPKAEQLKKDCVVINSNRYWETVDCSTRLPYICELIPDGPLSPVERYCAPITNIKRRKSCMLRNHKQFEKTRPVKQQCINDIQINKTEAKINN